MTPIKIHWTKKKMILASISLVLVAAILSTIYVWNRQRDDAPGLDINQVLITFDSQGGSPVESVVLEKGGHLAEMPVPERRGYVFTGWQHAHSPMKMLQIGESFDEDTAFFATWLDPPIIDNTADFLDKCQADIQFLIHSDIELNEGNWRDYVEFKALDGAPVELQMVKEGEKQYLFYAEKGFAPGFNYQIALKDSKQLYFLKAGDQDLSQSSKSIYTFRIFREEFEKIKLKAGSKNLAFEEVSSVEVLNKDALGDEADEADLVQRVVLTGNSPVYALGDIVLFGHSELEESGDQAQYYKVVATGEQDGAAYLDLATPQIDEVYSELDLCYRGVSGLTEQLEAQREAMSASIQKSLESSHGLALYALAISEAIKHNPTIQKFIEEAQDTPLNSASSVFFERDKFFQNKHMEAVSLSALPSRASSLSAASLKHSFSMGKPILQYDKLTNDEGKECGAKITVGLSSGKLTIEPTNAPVKIELILSLKNVLEVSAFGHTCKIGKDVYSNQGYEVEESFEANFEASVSYAGQKVDVGAELDDYVEVNLPDITKLYVEKLNREGLMAPDLDYVPIFETDLFEVNFIVAKVISIQIKVGLVASVGANVGLTLSGKVETRHVFGSTNGSVSFPNGQIHVEFIPLKKYHYSPWTKCSVELLMKGKIGIRVGIKVTASVSLLFLHKVFYVGASIEFGVYQEISAYAKMNYQYRENWGKKAQDLSFLGGFYYEVGLYVQLNFEWKVVKYKGTVKLADFKIPLFSIGSLEFPTGFTEEESRVQFSEQTFSLMDQGLLNMNYLNMGAQSGGKAAALIVRPDFHGNYAFRKINEHSEQGDYEAWEEEEKGWSYVDIDTNGNLRIKENAPERIDLTVGVYYLRATSFFSKTLSPITKTLRLTYMKNPNASANQQYTARFYGFGRLLSEKKYYAGKTPSVPWGALYELESDRWYEDFDFGKDWRDAQGKPQAIKAIWADTDYYLKAKKKVGEAWFYLFYFPNGMPIETLKLVKVPTEYGEIPIPPDFSDVILPDGVSPPSLDWTPGLKVLDRQQAFYTKDLRDGLDQAYVTFKSKNAEGKYERTAVVRGQLGELPKPPVGEDLPELGLFFDSWDNGYLRPIVSRNSDLYFARYYKKSTINYYGANGERLKTEVLKTKLRKAFGSRLANIFDRPNPPELTLPEGDFTHEYKFVAWETKDGQELISALAGDDGASGDYYPVFERVDAKTLRSYFDSGELTFEDASFGTKSVPVSYLPSHLNPVNEAIFNKYLLEAPKLAEREDDHNVYRLLYWEEYKDTTGENASLDRILYPGDKYYALNPGSFRAVMETQAKVYSLTIKGGDTNLYFEGAYGDVIPASAVDQLKKSSLNSDEYYDLINPGVQFPYTLGSDRDANNKARLAVEVEAEFQKVQRLFPLTFDANGGEFPDKSRTKVQKAVYGEQVQPPEAPVKTDVSGLYEFHGWTSVKDDESTLKSDGKMPLPGGHSETLYAFYVYRPYHEIIFDAGEGKFPDQEQQLHVKVPDFYAIAPFAPKTAPVKADTSELRFEFTGWSPPLQVQEAHGSQTFVAQFRPVRKTFRICFEAGEGTFLDGEKELIIDVENGKPLVIPPKLPVKKETAKATYSFDGWSPVFKPDLKADRDWRFVAQYKETLKSYTVSFDANQGSFADGIKKKEIKGAYGDALNFSEIPRLEGHRFVGWSPTLSQTITGQTSYSARYVKEEEQIYTLTFRSGSGKFSDGTTMKTIQGSKGTKVEFAEIPERATDVYGAHQFSSWDKVLPETISGDAQFMATYELTSKRLFKLTFSPGYQGQFEDQEGLDDAGNKSLIGGFDEIANIALDKLWVVDQNGKRCNNFYFGADGVLDRFLESFKKNWPQDWPLTIEQLKYSEAYQCSAIKYVPGETRLGLAAFYYLLEDGDLSDLPLDEVPEIRFMPFVPPY